MRLELASVDRHNCDITLTLMYIIVKILGVARYERGYED